MTWKHDLGRTRYGQLPEPYTWRQWTVIIVVALVAAAVITVFMG